MPLRPMGREQMWMLPLDHPARFVAEFVDALDRDAWAELGVDIEGDSMGAPAYHPRALLSVWLWLHDRCALVPKAGGGLPGPDTVPVADRVAASRPQYPVAVLQRASAGHEELFERTVRTAVAMKLVDLAVQAVDGTKVVANASVNRSYDAEGMRGLLDRLERAITDLEAQNEAGEDAAVARLPQKLADKDGL